MRGPQAPDVPKGLGGGGPFCIGIRQFRRDLAVKPQLHLYIYICICRKGGRVNSAALWKELDGRGRRWKWQGSRWGSAMHSPVLGVVFALD